MSDNNGSVQITSAGGTKPLHRFIRGQPKVVGVILLVLGTTIFIITAMLTEDTEKHFWTIIPPRFFQGALYIICGILYILTEHNPTKKTVTISLALSIVTLLGTLWMILHIVPDLIQESYTYRHYEYMEENTTDADYYASLKFENMNRSLEVIFLIKFLMGGVISIVMSTLGGIALRSTNSQAIVMMTAAPAEPPAE